MDKSKISNKKYNDQTIERIEYLYLPLIDIPDKCIVLTGAMKPAAFINSDAMFNIGCALGALQSKPAGVYIAMNGIIFNADRVSKNVTKNIFTEM